MTKDAYREFFAQCKPFIKLTVICKLADVHVVSFSRFMKGSEFNWCLSDQKLRQLYETLLNELEKIT